MSFNSLLRQTATIANPSGNRNKQGQPAYGSATTHKVRFQQTTKSIATKDRERTPIHGIVFVGKNATVEKDVQVVYNGTVYRVMAIEDVPGRNGQRHHLELMVQLWSFT